MLLRSSFRTDPSERVYLIFTNTVMRELDSQSQKRGYAFAQLIRNQFRMNDPENSLLAQCQRLGFVEMLGRAPYACARP